MNRSYRFLPFLFTGMVCLACFWMPLATKANINILSVHILNDIFSDKGSQSRHYSQLEQTASEICQANILLARLSSQQQEKEKAQAAWAAFLACSHPYGVNLVHAAAREDRLLAEQAVQLYPDNSESWFWLAEINQASQQTDQAILNYQRAVKIDPSNGVSWCRLGFLYEAIDIRQAIDAFVRCCENGDPGVNGCYNAGLQEENQGNLQIAIRYYRMSRYEPAQRRADDLEHQLNQP